MMTFRKLLVPLDGSEFSEHALGVVRNLARGLGAEVHLVHVLVQTPDYVHKAPEMDLQWQQEAVPGAERYLQEKAEEVAAGTDVTTRTAVLNGPVEDALVHYAEEEPGVDLIVLTSHGYGGVQRFWLGSTTDQLVRRSRVPLLVVRPWDEADGLEPGGSAFDHVAIPLDGSELAEGVVPYAEALGGPFDARYTLVHTVPASREVGRLFAASSFQVAPGSEEERKQAGRDYLEVVAQRMRERGLSVETQVLAADRPEEGIRRYLVEEHPHVLALGTHGRSGFSRVVMGSVADKILRVSARPVLVVRPPGAEEEERESPLETPPA